MMARMRVFLGSDHAGFELKAKLVAHLDALGHDAGRLRRARPSTPRTTTRRRASPPRTAPSPTPGSLGVVLGGSGNGEQIAANKVTGVRAALVWNDETARLAREHNDANVISLGARDHPDEDAMRFVEIFLATPFSRAERHAPPHRDAARVRGDRRDRRPRDHLADPPARAVPVSRTTCSVDPT